MKTALALLALVTFVAAGCGSPAPVSEPEPQLKLYSVPHGLAIDVRNAILEALRSPEGQPSRGRASLAPGGQVMVLASPLVHKGVQNLVSSLEGTEQQTRPSSIEITYWVVAGRPASGGNAALPNALLEVEAALESTADALGPQEFELIERLQVSSRSDARASATGAFTDVAQRAYPADGQIVANLEIRPAGRASLETEVKMTEGQTVVLAQTGLGSETHMRTNRSAEEGDIVLYIVRAVGRN